jgi:hypothetical protein
MILFSTLFFLLQIFYYKKFIYEIFKKSKNVNRRKFPFKNVKG